MSLAIYLFGEEGGREAAPGVASNTLGSGSMQSVPSAAAGRRLNACPTEHSRSTMGRCRIRKGRDEGREERTDCSIRPSLASLFPPSLRPPPLFGCWRTAPFIQTQIEVITGKFYDHIMRASSAPQHRRNDRPSEPNCRSRAEGKPSV